MNQNLSTISNSATSRPDFVAELRRLKDDGLEFQDCIEVFGENENNQFVLAAREFHHKDGVLEIDDTTVVSESEDNGAYVMSWVWVDGSDLSTLMVSKACEAFRRYEDLLAQVRKGGTAQGTARTAAKKEYAQALVELQPLGEWTLNQARSVLDKVRDANLLPSGYLMRMNEEGKLFLAGNVNTPCDVSLFVTKEGANEADPDQISFEVRVFVDGPRAFVPFTVGNRYAFQGTKVDIFPDGSPRAEAETYEELAEEVVSALREAIASFGTFAEQPSDCPVCGGRRERQSDLAGERPFNVCRVCGDRQQVENSDEAPLFRNFYSCPSCTHEWEDIWSATCDDDCPECGKRHISPVRSEDAA